MATVDLATTFASYLAGLFIWAGASKLVDLPAFRRTIRELGAGSGPAATRSALAVPVMELAGATLLVPIGTRSLGAFIVGSLLVTFTAVLAVNVRRGNAVPCNCFGVGDTTPISRWTLARNGWLFTVALVLGIVLRSSERDPLTTLISVGFGLGLILVHAVAGAAIDASRTVWSATRGTV
jgi:uncharacterized membrane protein YphA (DoxX/SURF4 family)